MQGGVSHQSTLHTSALRDAARFRAISRFHDVVAVVVLFFFLAVDSLPLDSIRRLAMDGRSLCFSRLPVSFGWYSVRSDW